MGDDRSLISQKNFLIATPVSSACSCGPVFLRGTESFVYTWKPGPRASKGHCPTLLAVPCDVTTGNNVAHSGRSVRFDPLQVYMERPTQLPYRETFAVPG